ncbi:MAG: NAD(P)-binding protein [Bacteroidota bacterium]|nr:NAD(P)-binding protein [Bacteroidota bacterium]
MSSYFLIAGAGFSGAVLAHRVSQLIPDCKIDIWEEKSHIAGNCYTARDSQTGIMVHQYGPHIFNTDKKEIWDFLNGFVELKPFAHKVKAISNGNVYTLPVTLHTINQFFNKTFSPAEAKTFLKSQADTSITDPKNFEEQALKFIGTDLYKAFFYGYTKKQWGCEPSELPAAILKRLPVRFNYDDNYYNNPYVGMPVEGYTVFVEKLLDKKNIHVTLNRKFSPSEDLSSYDHIFFTGPLDAFFNFRFGRLGYRTVTFEPFYANGDYQGTAVINYCDETVKHTRITEHKHFAPWEVHENTICFKEFSKETTRDDIPFYPKRLAADKELLRKYREEAELLKNVSFLGRLATYRYMDMHHVIGESLDFSEKFYTAFKDHQKLPVFPNIELL